MTLVEAFSQVDDPRRGQGTRFDLSQILTMVFLSYLCGYHSYRTMMKFCQSCQGLLEQELRLRHGIPSYITFRDVLQRLDETACITAFNAWADTYVESSEKRVSADGKSLSSTITSLHTEQQDFKAVVSIFGQESGLVYQIEQYRNKKVSEIEVLHSLLASLKGKGLLICADALHCQKKQPH